MRFLTFLPMSVVRVFPSVNPVHFGVVDVTGALPHHYTHHDRTISTHDSSGIEDSTPAGHGESLAPRHQIRVLRRPGKRPRLTTIDRGLWALLSRIWQDWRDGLVLVKPDTVVRWHRMGFKLYWRWKSRKRKGGRLRASPELTALSSIKRATSSLWPT